MTTRLNSEGASEIIARDFRKPSRCGPAGACVEVADTEDGGWILRDSTNPEIELVIHPHVKAGIIQDIMTGRFN